MDQELKKAKRGRTTIDDPARKQSHSVRAAKGTLSVECKKCPHCKHGKAFQNVNRSGFKCTRCKEEF